MSKIVRDKQRVKQTGEVFTPLPLVDEILGKMDPALFKDPTKTFIDNSCGDGNFLVRVIAHKIMHGSTPEEALSTTYGVDLMEDNVKHCRDRLLVHAFASQRWKAQGNEDLLPHLTYEDERDFLAEMVRNHEPFIEDHDAIVHQNVVCHDALTYDYSFGDCE